MSSDESDDGDDFVTFGSSLSPIEEEEIPRKKPVPIEEQVKRFEPLALVWNDKRVSSKCAPFAVFTRGIAFITKIKPGHFIIANLAGWPGVAQDDSNEVLKDYWDSRFDLIIKSMPFLISKYLFGTYTTTFIL